MADETKVGSPDDVASQKTSWDITPADQNAIDTIQEKRRLTGIALKVAQYIVQVASQINENGQVNYYFAGSLAASILPEVTSFVPAVISLDGSTEVGDEILVSETSRQRLLSFARILGDDIDVGVVNKDPYQLAKDSGNLAPNSARIFGNIPEVQDLFSFNFSGLIVKDMFDRVGCDTKDKIHHIAVAKMQDGKELIITDPAYIVGYKVFEYAFASNPKPSVGLDLKNLIDGVKSIYEDSITKSAIRDVCDERMADSFGGAMSHESELVLKKIEMILERI